VVLRFGWFYGPGAAHSEQMLSQGRHHIVMILGRPGSYQSSIYTADAGAAVAAALRVPSGIYNVVDDQPLTKREFADALASAAGTAPWIRGPGRAAALAGSQYPSRCISTWPLMISTQQRRKRSVSGPQAARPARSRPLASASRPRCSPVLPLQPGH
jgi:nucleoside-diphosphate-sugar epimerase